MLTYETRAFGWSASEELRNALKELEFTSGMPANARGSDTGTFWLFGKDVKKMEKMLGDENIVCIETPRRKFLVLGKPNHKAMECEFSVTTK